MYSSAFTYLIFGTVDTDSTSLLSEVSLVTGFVRRLIIVLSSLFMLCASILRRTVDYYTNRGSLVFSCFVDFSKVFDWVNYWKLFDKLLDDGVNSKIVRTLVFWYSHQQICVQRQSTV